MFTRNNLIELVFSPNFDGYDRVIDTHIKNLRKKVESAPKSPIYVKTVHGLGYKFGGDENWNGTASVQPLLSVLPCWY